MARKQGGLLGMVDYLVLAMIVSSRGEAYAIQLRKRLTERTGVGMARTTVYGALDRLVADGALKTRTDQPGGDLGGPIRTCWLITKKGRQRLKETGHAVWSVLGK
jgi:DNA-binding PadR family transcriptional regulator